MTRTDARRDAVVERLATNTVFHFAGHAIANSVQPELSYLALAPADSGNDGRLRGREIGDLRLSNMQLVVLSACRTLNPRASHVGAISGLAYSFLRAGVPATISTLWDVSDQATTDLLIDFHTRFASGVSAAEALRRAQLTSVRSERPELRAPRAWAAFIYTGP
jgi:CHAT domain-containing protein